MFKILTALTLVLSASTGVAAPCTKAERTTMKKAVYAAMSETLGIANTEEEIDGTEELRSDYLMDNAKIKTVLERAARKLNKEPAPKVVASYNTFKDLWSAFCPAN